MWGLKVKTLNRDNMIYLSNQGFNKIKTDRI